MSAGQDCDVICSAASLYHAQQEIAWAIQSQVVPLTLGLWFFVTVHGRNNILTIWYATETDLPSFPSLGQCTGLDGLIVMLGGL